MLELLTIIYRWKWRIAIFCSLALLASVIFSAPAFMTPQYRSFSVFYPSNPAATDRATLFGEDAGNRQINYFGTKNDVNRMLTIANSGGLMNHLIQKFSLVAHYEADTTNSKYMFFVAREFKGNYEAVKTDREAISISILDRDPEMASRMVNEAVQYINDVNNNIIRDNKQRTLDILQQEILNKESEIDQLTIRMKAGGFDEILSGQLAAAVEETGELKQLADQYKVSANEGFRSIYIIEAATPALMKSKPVRWMIVVFTGIGAFLFSTLIAVLLENFKHLKAAA